MPCYNPLTAWRRADYSVGPSGKLQLTFDRQNAILSTETTIPCGQCIGCRLDRARQWAIRCMHEASLHDDNCFITLTYDSEQLPPDNSLNKRDITLFLKRLRKHYEPAIIRYYQCGEYGELFARPHHHAILFGLDFADKSPYRQTPAGMLYTSDTLNTLWGKGYCILADVSFDTVCYVARYCLKKVTGGKADDHYNGRMPEYTTMSRRPGIGRKYYDMYTSDLYNYDMCVVKDKFVCKPPKYYDKLYDIQNPDHMAVLKTSRKSAAAKRPPETLQRILQKETHSLLTSRKKKRTYETPT